MYIDAKRNSFRALIGGSLIPALVFSMIVFAGALEAQNCTGETVVGDFELVFGGLDFDGDNTTFEYCVTGLDQQDFKALSNWQMSLATGCIAPDDLVSCSPEPCFYQEDDPHYGLDGVKFDDVEVERGETECFSFTLAGDWRGRLGDVELGMKAGQNVDFGNICGPTCCEKDIRVTSRPGEAPVMDVTLTHRLAKPVTTPIWYRLLDADQRPVWKWRDGPVRFEMGTEYHLEMAIPGGENLAPGAYKLQVRIRFMSGYRILTTDFVIE